MARLGPPEQRRDGRAGEHQYPAEVGAHDGFLLVEGHLPERHPARDDAGHGERGVQAAPPLLGLGHRGGHGRPVTGVGDEAVHLTRAARGRGRHGVQIGPGAQVVRQRRIIGAAVDSQHGPALGGQRAHGGGADAAGGPGDQRDPGHG